MKHVIIGAGAAGLTAAKTIRKLRPADDITVVSEDQRVNSRCMLHHYISGERDADALRFVPEGFFSENRIEWLRGFRVTGVDTAAKAVLCEGGKIPYDKLLIATGAESIKLPIGDLATAKNAFGLRHFSDAEAIRKAAEGADRVVVIGAGLVGLDAAYALVELKKDIAVVDIAPQLMVMNMDERAAKAYHDRFEEAGVRFHLGRKVMDAKADGEGNVRQVVLDDGQVLNCDFLVVAAGVRPAVSFLDGSGIAYDRAVTVDQHLATNCPDVYAAGDVAGLSAIWPNALRQGEVAGKNMCGEKTAYEDSFAIKNTVNFFGLLTLSVGALHPADGDLVFIREDRRNYQKLILSDGRVSGVVLQGNISGSGFWQYLIKNGIKVDGLNTSLWKLSYADFYETDEDGAYVWAANG